MITISGTEPGTAMRVFAQAGCAGFVRLQQYAYAEGIGWYVQKSMVIERDVLEVLIPQLRKALCLMPKGKADGYGPIPFPRIAQQNNEAGDIARAG
ncbi:MAG TPA: hypothetical protein VHD56_10430 [Tepidisphaeraceae bacterium]|nr:hypothetical protein [Tepidisphaeraceae bacterium]